jgi:hypothetical protein
MKLNFLFLTLIVLLAPLHLKAQYEGKLGINLGSIHADGYVDMIKAALPWDHGSTDSPLTGEELDENLWPKKDFRLILMDNRPVAEWSNSIDDPDKYRVDYSGTYKSSFNGIAKITNIGGSWSIQNQAYDSATNTTTFDLVISPPGPNHGLVIMYFENTKHTADSPNNSGITNISIIRPGYENNKAQFFADHLVDAITGGNFSVIREQGFTGTTSWQITYPAEYEWSQRKLPGDPIQANPHNGKRESAAWEHFIDLCNLARMDIWLNVPISASADYVRNLASLVKNRLDTTLNIYVENDNEVWNSAPGFIGTYNYNLDEAAARGISDQENIARRAVELSQIFAEVFGQPEINHRVRVILASHAPMLKWWVIPMLQYIRDNYGDPKNIIYGISRQTYFDTQTATDNIPPDQIINDLYANINYQLVDDPVNEAGRLDWVRVAGEWQLPGGATSYEGGPSTPSGGSTSNLSNQIIMHRSERMISLLRYNIVNNWFDIGAGLALHFTLVSGYSRYGCWGLTDDLRNPDRNYKMEALRNLQTVTSLDESFRASYPLIYPNPTHGIITVNTGNPDEVSMEIFDIHGRAVYSSTRILPGKELELNLSGNGMYFVKVKGKSRNESCKILYQR